jgi:hypothetical protein
MNYYRTIEDLGNQNEYASEIDKIISDDYPEVKEYVSLNAAWTPEPNAVAVYEGTLEETGDYLFTVFFSEEEK